jgi:hypothetical protein
MLPPGVPGLTDTSACARWWGVSWSTPGCCTSAGANGRADEALYLSSADWMSRNMQRRIEMAWPVRDPALRQRVIDECLVPYLHDRRDAWELDAEGHYQDAPVLMTRGARPATVRREPRPCCRMQQGSYNLRRTEERTWTSPRKSTPAD